jgi:hypothetical protein
MRDDEIDALVRRAADLPVNTGRLQSAVRAGMAPRAPGLFDWMQGRARLVPAAFAAVLVATPLVVGRLPGEPGVALAAALALGDPLLIGPGGLP